jgi:hypothetical protein
MFLSVANKLRGEIKEGKKRKKRSPRAKLEDVWIHMLSHRGDDAEMNQTLWWKEAFDR